MENSKFDYQLSVDTAYLTNIEIQAQKLRAQASADMAKALVASIATAFTNVTSWVVRMNERRRVINELYAMDDRTLADIGITRGEIEDVVNGKLSKTLEPVPANIAFMKPAASHKTAEVAANKEKIAA